MSMGYYYKSINNNFIFNYLIITTIVYVSISIIFIDTVQIYRAQFMPSDIIILNNNIIQN